MKYQILKNDFADVKHPTTGKMQRLYRIIAMQDILSPFHGTILNGTIGGFVQSEENLSMDDGSWVFHMAKVFDNAKITNNTVVYDLAIIYGQAVVSSSFVKDFVRIYSLATVNDSMCVGRSIIRDRATVRQSTIANSALIEHEANVELSTVKDGAMVRDRASITHTTVQDTAEICGNSISHNCVYGGRYICDSGTHYNESLFADDNLTFETGGSEQ